MSEIRGTHASRIIYTQVISNFIEALYSNEIFKWNLPDALLIILLIV